MPNIHQLHTENNADTDDLDDQQSYGRMSPKKYTRAASSGSGSPSKSPSRSKTHVSSSSRLLKEADTSVQDFIKQIRYHEKYDAVNNTNSGVHKTLVNLEKLACSDKEMVLLQRKTIYVQQLENQSLLKKLESLKRNFDAISLTNKNLLDQVQDMRMEVESVGFYKMSLEEEKKRILSNSEE